MTDEALKDGDILRQDNTRFAFLTPCCRELIKSNPTKKFDLNTAEMIADAENQKTS